MSESEIEVIGTSSVFIYRFNTPLTNVRKIAFLTFKAVNLIPNVDEKKNRFKLKDPNKDGGEWTVHELAPGSFLRSDLSRNFHKITKVKIHATASHGRLWFRVPRGIFLDFDVANSLADVIGADKKIIGSDNEDVEYHCPHEPNLVPYQIIHIHCNMVQGSILNGANTHIIHSFYPHEVKPSQKIYEDKERATMRNVCLTGDINQIEIKVTDEKMRPLDFRGKEIFIKFRIWF